MRRRHFLQALSALALAPLLPHQPAEPTREAPVELPDRLPAEWQGMLVKGPDGQVFEYVKAQEAIRQGVWVQGGRLRGMAVADIDAGYYGWVQVQGPACVPLVFG